MSRFELMNIKGMVDNGNSTNTPLAGGATFTGAVFQILNYGIIFISVYSDVASATDGLCIEQSHDGTNWDHDDCYTVPADHGKNYSINPFARYYRIRYTNGGSAQSVFRLQAIVKGNAKGSSHRVQDDISTDDDAELVKAAICSDSGDGSTFKNIDAQHPLSISGDTVYEMDVDQTRSTSVGFTGGEVIDLFNDRYSVLVNSTATNPKEIVIEFKRPVQTNILGFGTTSGTFSNTKMIATLGVGADAIDYPILDESTDPTPKSIILPPVPPLTITKLTIQFHTANTCSVSTVGVSKSTQTISRIQGVTQAGTVGDVGVTNKGQFKVSIEEYGDTPAIDAFDRLRVSNPYTIFDSKLLHDNQPLFWNQEIGGSATSTHNSSNSCNELVVTASASDYVIDQTKQRFNYQPGKGQLILMTYLASQETGITKRIGYFSTDPSSPYYDPENGIYLEVTDSDITVNVAKNGVVTESVSQANWNVDPLDGTGYSGITLDPDATLILVIDFEWLGVGRIRIGQVINGIIYYCHYFTHANESTFDSVYMKTPNLPLTYSIASDGSGAGQLDHICCSVMSEGGLEKTGILRSIDNGVTAIVATSIGSAYAMIGIRLKSTYNDISILPEALSMISTSNDSFRWSLHLNPTVAGTFTYNDLANSAIQYAIGTSANTLASLTDGTIIASGYGSAETKQIDIGLRTALRIGSTIDGVRDTLILAVSPLGANADILSSLNFRELI